MPVMVRKRGDKYRVVEKATGRIVKTDSGKPRDGGGHRDKGVAKRQAQAINSNR